MVKAKTSYHRNGRSRVSSGYIDRHTMDPGVVVKNRKTQPKYTREEQIRYLRKLIEIGEHSLELTKKEEDDAVEALGEEVNLTPEGIYLNTLGIPLFTGHEGATEKSLSMLRGMLSKIAGQRRRKRGSTRNSRRRKRTRRAGTRSRKSR